MTRKQAIVALASIAAGYAGQNQPPKKSTAPDSTVWSIAINATPPTVKLYLAERKSDNYTNGGIGKIEIEFEGKVRSISAREIWNALEGG